MSSNDWFYAVLEKERDAYEMGNNTTPSRMKELSKKQVQFLQADDSSLKPSQKSIRHRARSILKDIFASLGPEVLLLCCCVSLVNLSKVKPEGLLRDLKLWWDRVPHPQSLITAADTLYEKHPLQQEEHSLRQEGSSERTPANGMKHIPLVYTLAYLTTRARPVTDPRCTT
jgi:hypothetical protein